MQDVEDLLLKALQKATVFFTRKKFLIKGRDVPGNANNMLEPNFKIWFLAFKKPIPSMYGKFRVLAFSVRLESS